jgi:lysozyme
MIIGGANPPRPLRRALLAACAPLALLAAPAPGNAAQGIDVSRFQGTINWYGVSRAKADISFAFVQASRGSGSDCTVAPSDCGADPYYALNYKRARKHGIRVGAYHRAFVSGPTIKRAKADARAEADTFVAAVGRLHRKDLLPVLDLESPFSGTNPRRLRIWVRIWLRQVRKKLGPKPLIYTNRSSWSATGDTTEFAERGHRLWVANWHVRSPSVPAGNWAGQGWSVWQFASDARIRGISGRVDRDRLRVRFRKLSVKGR